MRTKPTTTASAPETRPTDEDNVGSTWNWLPAKIEQARTIPAEKPTAHTPNCASLPNSKASKYLGQCYCDCGLDSQWRIWEEIDGTTQIFPIGVDPDDLAFGRVKPIAIIPEGTPFEVAKLIAAAPQTQAHAAQLAEALRNLTGRAVTGLHQDATHDGLVNCEAIARARQALAAYESEVR